MVSTIVIIQQLGRDIENSPVTQKYITHQYIVTNLRLNITRIKKKLAVDYIFTAFSSFRDLLVALWLRVLVASSVSLVKFGARIIFSLASCLFLRENVTGLPSVPARVIVSVSSKGALGESGRM